MADDVLTDTEPASSSAPQQCFHCGLPVPPRASYSVSIDGQPRPMCCRGCEAVAQAIVAGGLGHYYRHRTQLPQSPQEVLPEFLLQLPLYDSPEVQRSFVKEEAGQVREAALILEGIACAACVWLNEQHIARLPGVLGVEINYSTHRARVRWDDSRIRLSEILQAVVAIGYTAHPFDPGRYEEVHRRERKAALRRLFVAGFGAMQVMMYAVPVYLASDGTMAPGIERLMHWASLLLTLPVVLYSAGPFFLGAWRDLRLRRLGMDVPVALGIGGAFLASAWATVLGRGEVYFDSVAMFVFFLLCGRFLEAGVRARASGAVENLVRLIPAFAALLPGFPGSRETEQVPVSSLKPGDFVLVRPGEAVPADGRVEQGESQVDESLLSGESRPVAKQPGEALTGGSVNAVSPLLMRVERVGQDTVLSGIVRLLDRAQTEKPRIALVADRAASWFVLALLLGAAGVAVTWYTVDPQRALWITVSVLVATCPCALSLATPVALTAATGSLTRLGLLTTRGHALETLARATHFVFDKTGTLTHGRMALLETVALGAVERERCLALAASLEHGSEHPVARALIDAAQGLAPEAAEVRNFPGLGVEGRLEGRRCRLGAPRFVMELSGGPLPAQIGALPSSATVVALGDEAGWLALFALGDRLRGDAHLLVRGLQGMGRQVCLLSGDRPEAVAEAAAALGIDCARGGASPAEKLEYVRALQRQGAVVAMVGDGINDAPVLAQAQVSVAMGGGTQVAQATADMVLLSGQLTRLLEGLAVATRTTRIIRQNLWWALAYNCLILPFAALGHVTPWMAGIGMSASSLLVVLNAARLARRRPAAGAQEAETGLGASERWKSSTC